MMDQVDVVIVGAGVSGLTAGYRLLQKEPQLKIVVLEANGLSIFFFISVSLFPDFENI